MAVAVRAAKQGDLPSIGLLLSLVDLTVAGVDQHLEHFLVVEDGGKIVACAGLETYGSHAFLRSVAVHPHYRKRGLATSLVTRLVDQARQDRLRAVYLLTTSAEAYFRRLGFATIPREDVDPRVKQSAEFGEGVCATARAMVLPLQAIAKHKLPLGDGTRGGVGHLLKKPPRPKSSPKPSRKRKRGKP
jgi:amino-acid N-acetyltransferase